MLGFMLLSCGDETPKSKAKIITDPFKTTDSEPLSEEKQKIYQQRKLTESAYRAILDKVKQTGKEVEKQGGNLSYSSIDYDKNTQKALIKDMLIDYPLDGLIALPISNFVDSKKLEISWYDEKNTVPYYIMASMQDVLVANEAFLISRQGKEFIHFFTTLGTDYKKLNNLSDLAYEFDVKTGQIALALNEDFHKLFSLRVVTRMDGVSKQMLELFADTKSSTQNPGMLLGMLSSIRLQEVYVKIKLERTIEEIFAAMPQEDAEQARKDYTKNKNISDEEIIKRVGKAYTPEKIKQYRNAWIQFLEHKKQLVISIKPDIPQAFSALFANLMMAQKNPEIASGIVEQLKLSISN